MVILFLLRQLKALSGPPRTCVISLKGGALDEEFKRSCDEYIVLPEFKNAHQVPSLWTRIRNKLGIAETEKSRKDHRELDNLQTVDLIYANTAVCAGIAHDYRAQLSKDCRLILHIHELEVVLRRQGPGLKDHLQSADRIIAASELVKSNLIRQWDIPEEKLVRVYECSEIEARKVKKDRTENAPFIIGGSGTVHWRKGSDLFIQTAIQLRSLAPERRFEFRWVGGISVTERDIIEEDIRKADLGGLVRFTGETDQPDKYFNDFDLFLMCSREDPFPLVCIEVGMMGKPILVFEGATGTQEFLNDGGGKVIPYLDTLKMAEAIAFYMNDSNALIADGQRNAEIFAQFGPEEIIPQILQLIDSTLSA